MGLHGERRPLDTGSVNGEHFAVMAGAGFDARMIKEADGGMKDRIGRLAYLYTGARNLSARRVKATIEVDGKRFFTGRISCVLAGNVGKVLGGVEAFGAAEPDDGLLDLGVVTAKDPAEWARTLGRVALGKAEKSPFVAVRRVSGSGSGSIGGFPTSLTAVRAPLSGRCGSRVPEPSASQTSQVAFRDSCAIRARPRASAPRSRNRRRRPPARARRRRGAPGPAAWSRA